MGWPRRVAVVGLALAGAYLGVLFLGGFALRGCVEDRVRDRLARSLDAEIEIGTTRVHLWSGDLVLEDVRARRDHGGLVELDIARIEADLAGWGGLLFDREVDDCRVIGLDLRVSAAGLVDVARARRQPLRIARLELEDARITAMPTAILPGLGRVEVEVPRATSVAVELAHGLSWLSGLRELVATTHAPGGVVGVEFRQGELAVSGSLFGSAPVRLPFKMPTVEPDAYELDQLAAIGKELLRSAGKYLLKQEVRDRVIEGIWDLID